MGQEHSAPCEILHRQAGPRGSLSSQQHSSTGSSLGRESCCSRQPEPQQVSRTTSSASSLASSSARQSVYTNVHYRDVNNNNIYRPLKINKNKIHRLKLLEADKDTALYLEKHLSIKSYVDTAEIKKIKEGAPLPEPTQKKSGIRNYTPKILSEKNIQKDLEHWI